MVFHLIRAENGILKILWTTLMRFLILIETVFSWNCGYGSAANVWHTIRTRHQERNVQNSLPTLQGAVVQAHGHPQEHEPQLCSLHHPQPWEEGWKDQCSSCPRSTKVQWRPRGNQNLSPGFPQSYPIPRVQTEVWAPHPQRYPQGIHGRQEGLWEDDWSSGAWSRSIQNWTVQDFLPCRSFGSPWRGAWSENHWSSC